MRCGSATAFSGILMLASVSNAVALPANNSGLEVRANGASGGGINAATELKQITKDHNKFVNNPQAATVPFATEVSEAREDHRLAHAASAGGATKKANKTKKASAGGATKKANKTKNANGVRAGN